VRCGAVDRAWFIFGGSALGSADGIDLHLGAIARPPFGGAGSRTVGARQRRWIESRLDFNAHASRCRDTTSNPPAVHGNARQIVEER
jgi:hypothetical protein